MKYSPYSLIASGQLNARSLNSQRHGFLIQTGDGGYGCVHPWPEQGDATLEEELEGLKRGKPLPLGIRALECARVDAEARKKGINLLDSLTIPASHATLPPSVSPATVRMMDLHGFETGKIKAMPNIAATRERLAVLAAMAPTWRWRIDFDASVEVGDVLQFWHNLSPALRELIDFIEDPCPYTSESWNRLAGEGIPLACDMASTDEHQPPVNPAIPHYRIVKPAREATPQGAEGVTFVFTSVMDHPLGQIWAAYNAALYYRDHPDAERHVCGLCTHNLFDEDDFNRQLGPLSPILGKPKGTGLGFDEQFARLDWLDLD